MLLFLLPPGRSPLGLVFPAETLPWGLLLLTSFPAEAPPWGLFPAEAHLSVGRSRARETEMRAGPDALPWRPASPNGSLLVHRRTMHRSSGGATRTGKVRCSVRLRDDNRSAPGA